MVSAPVQSSVEEVLCTTADLRCKIPMLPLTSYVTVGKNLDCSVSQFTPLSIEDYCNYQPYRVVVRIKLFATYEESKTVFDNTRMFCHYCCASVLNKKIRKAIRFTVLIFLATCFNALG